MNHWNQVWHQSSQNGCAAHGSSAVFTDSGFHALLGHYFPGPIDRNVDHFRRYFKRSWRELAESAGVSHPAHSRYCNSAGLLGWRMNAGILHRNRQSESQIDLFDRFFVPVLSRLERIIEPPLGQSIFTMLETH